MATSRKTAGTVTIPANNFPAGYLQNTTDIGAGAKTFQQMTTGANNYAALQFVNELGVTKIQGSIDGVRFVLLQAEAQNIRWRDDGIAPTATTGNLLIVGSTLNYTGDLNKIQFIAATAGAILNANFYT